MNLANILTVTRFFAVPFFLYFMYFPGHYFKAFAFLLFVAASITDYLDGYVARRYNMATEFGKFMDPLADKALVLGAFLMLTIAMHQMEIWMLAVIVGRDLMITLLRVYAKRRDVSIRTTYFAKAKTAFQMTAVITILLILAFAQLNDIDIIERYYQVAVLRGDPVFTVAMRFMLGGTKLLSSSGIVIYLYSFLPYLLTLSATTVTAISGLDYLYRNRELFSM